MKHTTALKKLKSILGATAGYRIDNGAPTPEERAEARAELPAATAERNRLKEARAARGEALLQADPEYQALKAEYDVAAKRAMHLSGMTYRHRITAGKVIQGLLFSVLAEGDTWEEVFEKLAKKKAA